MKKLTWRNLNHILATKTEEEVLQMLNEEKAGTQRVVVLERLHQRYNVLRVSRERLDAVDECLCASDRMPGLEPDALTQRAMQRERGQKRARDVQCIERDIRDPATE